MCGVMLHCVVLHYSVQLFVRCSACFLAPACDWNLIIFWYLHDCWYMIEECNKNEKPCCIGHKGCASHTHTHTHTHTLLWPSRHIKTQRSLEKETLCLVFLAHLIIDIVQWKNIVHACRQYDPCIDCSILIQISSQERKIWMVIFRNRILVHTKI